MAKWDSWAGDTNAVGSRPECRPALAGTPHSTILMLIEVGWSVQSPMGPWFGAGACHGRFSGPIPVPGLGGGVKDGS